MLHIERQEWDPKLSREGWQSGAWDEEPDLVVWVHPPSSYSCVASRSRGGAWRGYVGIPATHPLAGVGYDDAEVRVHGGLTYAGPEVPSAPEWPAGWWFGFDCAHAWDKWDLTGRFDWEGEPYTTVYRDLDYVAGELESLANQLYEKGSNDATSAAADAKAEDSPSHREMSGLFKKRAPE